MTNTYDRFNSWKGLAYLDKLELCANDKNPTPINWHVYPSNNCNYNCNFCIMKERKPAKLENATLDKLVEDASNMDVKLVHISGGGEPLTHQYMNTFIKNLRKQGIKIALSTNGYFLDELTEPVDHLRISFDAGNRDNYRRIHGNDGFNRVINNISQAVEKNKGRDVGLGFVLTHENYRDVEDFVRMAEKCNVDFVHIRPAYWPEKDKIIRRVTKKINPKSDKIDVFFVSDKFKGYWNNDKWPCKATPIHAVLDATGEFLLCQDRLDLRWGNYNVQSFKEIWNAPEHNERIRSAQSCNIRCVESGLNKMICNLDKLRLELI